MRHPASFSFAALALLACGTSQPATAPTVRAEPVAASSADTEAGGAPQAESDDEGDKGNAFRLRESEPAKDAKGGKTSKITSTATEAAMKLTVIDKAKGPIKGIVISLTAPDGTKYYTEETDEDGYAEVLVPVGRKYDITYLTLGRKDITASVNVSNEPKQNIKLTLRYKRFDPPPVSPVAPAAEPRFVLNGVTFDTGKAIIRPESFARLDSVAEFMTYKKSARIQISGHTDNVGNPKINKALSEKRAHACRDYLISKGIDGSRIEAAGFGDEHPVASNDTEEGRQKNRRIEATEL